jgi:hypothetical protein
VLFRSLKALEDRLKQLYHSDPATAIAAAEHLLASGIESVSLSILVARNMILANHLLAANRTVQGLSTSVPGDRFWLKYCQADVHKRLSNFDIAADQMDAALELENDSLWAHGEYESVLQARLEQAERNAKTAADAKNYGPARAQMDLAIDQCFESLRFYGVDASIEAPARPPTDRPMRIGFLADNYLPQCKLYRVDQKVEQLKLAGIGVECFDFRTQLFPAINRAGLFDAWILYRVPSWFHILRLVKLVRSLGRPVIYEIDDLLVDPEHYPEPLSAFDASITPQDYAGLVLSTSQNAGVARHCDYAIASTPPLAAELSKLVRSGKAFVHRNALSGPHFKAMANAIPPPRERAGDRIRIFYGSGTKAHKDYLEQIFFSGLADVMDALPKVDFVGVGFVPSETLSRRFGDRIILHEPIWDPVEYWRLLATCHINVAVLKPSLLTDCKSEIKWMEAAMVGVPTVMSPTATLAEVAKEGRTALFASSVDEWRAKLSRLAQAPELRDRLAALARQDVLDRYNLPDMADRLKENFKAVLAHHAGEGEIH